MFLEQQFCILEWFLKGHVTLNTGVMAAENNMNLTEPNILNGVVYFFIGLSISRWIQMFLYVTYSLYFTRRNFPSKTSLCPFFIFYFHLMQFNT